MWQKPEIYIEHHEQDDIEISLPMTHLWKNKYSNNINLVQETVL